MKLTRQILKQQRSYLTIIPIWLITKLGWCKGDTLLFTQKGKKVIIEKVGNYE